MPLKSNCIISNFTLIKVLLRRLQQQELINENSVSLLRLESNMYILLKFLWDKQWHGVQNFHFLDI
jgi:hypothetical protein